MLTLANVHAAYDRVEVLAGVVASIKSGCVTALVGSNGAGKTSLLRAILGAMPHVSGKIEFRNTSIVGMSSSEIVRMGICLVPEGRRIFSSLTVLENLKVGGYVCADDSSVASRLDGIFELFPRLAERREFLGSSLSGGEQQMLAVGRALMARPQLLLLDEPSMGLAPIVVDQIFRVIETLRSDSISVLLVEQNAHRALAIADNAYVLENGRIVLSGSGSELLTNPRVIDAYLGT